MKNFGKKLFLIYEKAYIIFINKNPLYIWWIFAMCSASQAQRNSIRWWLRQWYWHKLGDVIVTKVLPEYVEQMGNLLTQIFPSCVDRHPLQQHWLHHFARSALDVCNVFSSWAPVKCTVNPVQNVSVTPWNGFPLGQVLQCVRQRFASVSKARDCSLASSGSSRPIAIGPQYKSWGIYIANNVGHWR